jgi:two-component system OmpR family sensor kinase
MPIRGTEMVEAPQVRPGRAGPSHPTDERPRQWQGGGLFGSMRVRIVAAVVLLLALSAGVSIVILRGVLLQRLDEEISVDNRQEVEEFELLAGGLDPRTGQPFGQDLPAIFDLYFAREVPDEGETLLAFVDGDLYRTERAPDAVRAGQLEEPIDYWLSLDEREDGRLDTAEGEARYVALPITEDRQRGLFVVANFPAFEQNEINDAVRLQALTQFATIVLASLIGLGLAGRVLRPLRSLADTAQTISETDLTRRIPVRGEDEASRIAGAFNDMLGRLEAAFETQRQFLDDASHELRVPLTVIRGNVELLELETDPGERDAMVALITNEIDRMSRIVEDLLLLARAERPGFLSLERVDLAELTADVVRKAATLCGRDWEFEESAPLVIVADGQRLTQAMMQLAENACQHTDEAASIRIGSRAEQGHAVLWVHDSGPGVAPEDAERVFQRYVKGAARPGSGLGLGLSIVAAIAEAHGGRARLAEDVDRGARFEIIVPAVPAEPASETPVLGDVTVTP